LDAVGGGEIVEGVEDVGLVEEGPAHGCAGSVSGVGWEHALDAIGRETPAVGVALFWLLWVNSCVLYTLGGEMEPGVGDGDEQGEGYRCD